MLIFWIIRLAIVAIALIMFLRRSNATWAAALLAGTGVVLLDVLRERGLLEDSGFLTYFLGGVIAGGAFVWLAGLRGQRQPIAEPQPSRKVSQQPSNTPRGATVSENTAFDRQMIYDQIRTNLGPDDVLDLVFDLGINENDVVNPNLSMPQVIVNVMDEAQAMGKTSILAMAVERILTPVPKENLPRLEKLSADSPLNLIRQFLIANYSLNQLAQLTTSLGIDWEEFGTNAKKTRVRKLLLYLTRRNRLPELFAAMNSQSG